MSTNEDHRSKPDANDARPSSDQRRAIPGPGAPWSTAELLEASTLDALGLLDEQERRQFEEGFAVATPTVKAMLRAHQSMALRSYEAQLPSVKLPTSQPSPSLRQRVIEAILSAAREAPTSVLARIGPSGGEPQPAEAQELAELERLSRLAEAGTGRSRRVHAVWRAAAIGCMAAAVLFGVVSVQLWGQFRRLDSQIRTNTVAEVFAKEFGPRFEASLMNPQTRFVQFEAPAGAFAATQSGAGAGGAGTGAGAGGGIGEGRRAVAVMLLERAGKVGHFFARDLPPNTPMTLALVSPDGSTRRVLASFVSSDARTVQQLADLEIPDGARIELYAAAEPVPLLRSVNL
jgi:hypothetical protein